MADLAVSLKPSPAPVAGSPALASVEQVCCLKRCLTKWTLNELSTINLYYRSLQKPLQLEFLQNNIVQLEDEDTKELTRKMLLHLPVDVTLLKQPCHPSRGLVCVVGMCKVLQVNTYAIYHAHTPRRLKQARSQDKLQRARGWLLELLRVYNVSPITNHVYVPYENRLTLFRVFGHAHPDISYTTFERAWHLPECRKIRIRRWNMFPACSDCSLLERELKIYRGNEAKITEIRDKIVSHEALYRGEKQLYRDRTRLAMEQPDKYMSVIIDGADQADFDIPNLAKKAKFMENRKKIELQVMGLTICFWWLCL